jgi:gamma-glutamylcyclotransferase (GGCT)/AIG2-like uncharacterized protein YtfP
VTLVNGLAPKSVTAYIGVDDERLPARGADGDFRRRFFPDTTVYDVKHVFVYGTLMPGELRWPSLAPYAIGKPVAGTIKGTLYDTGHGFPAFFADGEGAVPGYLIELNPESAAKAWQELDDIEGTASGPYRRQSMLVTTADGKVIPAYTYTGYEHLRGTPIPSWPVAG